MQHRLQRLTTRYVDTEDRIQITGTVETGASVLIWITQRLMQRLVTTMLACLTGSQQNSHSELVNEFAQQAARAALEPQAAVVANAESAAWMAIAITVNRHENGIELIFRAHGDAHLASLFFDELQLRQWLNIVHGQYVAAEWPLGAWPDWVQESGMPASAATGPLH